MFVKSFDSFAEGMKALMASSFSVADVFGHRCDIQPRGLDVADERSVRSWLGACAEYRGTGNGVGWSIEYYGSPYGAAYRTRSGLVFGWRYFPGMMADEPVFFCVDVPGAPKNGWAPLNPGNPFFDGMLVQLAGKVGWRPAEVPAD